KSLRLDLTDALAGDVEVLADFFESVVALLADAEAHAENLLLARREGLEDAASLQLEVVGDDRLDRGDRVLVLDEIAQARVFFLADGGLEADGLLGDLEDLPDLLERHLHALGDLLGRGLAAELLDQIATRPDELVDGLDHVDRDADRPRLVGDGARDRLTDPP